MAGRLGILFEKRAVLKEYHAIVLGVPKSHEGTISVALGIKTETGHNIRTPDPQGETARTDYQVLSVSPDYSFLKIIPHTGRTHQIRAHLAFLGHPIAGDKIYIDPRIFERYIHEGWQEDMRPVVKTDRLLLHATTLGFRHPVTGEAMKFSAEIPPCFDEFLNKEKRVGPVSPGADTICEIKKRSAL
jgi:23S rRNA pseudouridine1911/1915/1917 synthase